MRASRYTDTHAYLHKTHARVHTNTHRFEMLRQLCRGAGTGTGVGAGTEQACDFEARFKCQWMRENVMLP